MQREHALLKFLNKTIIYHKIGGDLCYCANKHINSIR